MPISRGLGIPFKNTLKYGARNNNIPCLLNCVFWGKTVDSDSYNSAEVNGLEYKGKLIKSNGVLFNGADNYYDLSAYVPQLKLANCGRLLFHHQSTVDLSSRQDCIFSLTLPGATTDYSYVKIGNSTGVYPNETITFIVRNSNLVVLVMYLRLGSNFLNDGECHKCELIIDGINNRFVVDDITYDEDSGYVTFDVGSKTTLKMFDIPAATNAYIGRHFQAGVPVFYYSGTMAGFSICDVIDIPYSDGSTTATELINNNKISISGSETIRSTQDCYHRNVNDGFSDYMINNSSCNTLLTHQHSDRIEFSAYLMAKSIILSDIINTGYGIGTKGIFFRTIGTKLQWGYSNGTNIEMFESPLNEVIPQLYYNINLLYENGTFTVNVDSNTYQNTISIAAYSGDSDSTIKVNTGTEFNIFRPAMEYNNNKVELLKVPAIGLYTLDNLRTKFTPYETIGDKELVVLEIGEANMQGAGAIYSDVTEPEDLYVYESVSFNSGSGNWNNMAIGKNKVFAENNFYYGSEISCYRQLSDYYKHIFVTQFSRGGTSMWNNWNINLPGSLYLQAIDAMLESGKIASTIRIIQGESDTDTLSSAQSWKTSVIEIIEHYRSNYNANVKVFISKISTSTSYNPVYVDIINTSIDELLSEGYVQGVIETDTFDMSGNNYTYTGYNQLGLEFANVMIPALNATNLSLSNNRNIVLNAETELDFTNEGANTGVDVLLSSWKYGDVTGLEGKHHFFTPIKDDNENVIGTENHLIYSSEISNPCLTKTIKALKLIPEYLLADVNGNLILDNNNNYIITADWYR